MRSNVPEFRLVAPQTLQHALDLMSKEPGVWRPFAGGTDLMVLLEAGKLEHRDYFSIWHLPELKGIEETMEHVTLGALTTYTEVLAQPMLQSEFPLLCAAARETGGIATQNRGTLGGNIVNASPAADSPPALLVYDAELDLVSASGSRWVPYYRFHLGYKQMDLAPYELLRSIRLPRTKSGPSPADGRLGMNWRHYYRKVGTRRAQAISKVCFAGVIASENGVVRDVRVALGSVAPVPLRCPATEEALRGKAITRELVQSARAALAGEISPIDDMRSTAAYRSRVAQNLLAEFVAG